MRHLDLPDSPSRLPVLGLGTWRMGESRGRRAAEVAAVRAALELGYRLIDTAEMYGEGGAEEIVGEALEAAIRAGDVRREDVVVVSKVYPHNASRQGTIAACDRSRRRLRLDHLDLYLLHWRGQHPLGDTVDAMQELVAKSQVAHWGVSNFDREDMEELADLADDFATDQVWFSPGERGAEFDLLPWLQQHRRPMMAYSPIDMGRRARDRTLRDIGGALGLSAAQVALAWVIGRPGVVAIPKSTDPAHLRENLAAAELTLDAETLARIDAAFPPPDARAPLAMN